MGSNRRYAEAIDRRMDERILDRSIAGVKPVSLTTEELRLDVEPLTKTPVPRPVKAWVRYGTTPAQVEGEAVAWTTRAVAVGSTTATGETHRAWLWASAVVGRD